MPSDFQCRCVVFISVVLCFSLLSPTVVLADGKENLFKSGLKLFNAGDYEAAAETFRAAYQTKPSWKILYNIGQSEAAAKQYDLALDTFETYLVQGGDDIPPERREEVLAEVARLRQMVGSLEVKAPDGAAIYVDDVERGTAPLVSKLTITAGIEHRIRAVLDGKPISEKVFRIRGNEVLSIELRDEAAEPPRESVSSETVGKGAQHLEGQSKSKPGLSPLGISGGVLVGLGAGALIAAIVTGVMTKNLDAELQEECPGGDCPDSSQDDKVERMESLRTTTNVLLISGGVVAAAGVSMVIVDLVRNRKRKSQTVATPVVSSSCFGLQMQRSF